MITDSPARPPRLSISALMHAIGDEVFSLHRGIPWTVAGLVWRPGLMIRRYIEQRDPRITPPVRLLLLFMAVFALFLHDFADGFSRGYAAGFADSMPGGAPSARLLEALQQLHWLLLACWAPSIGGAMQRAYPALQLNAAEAVVFGLYTLAPALLLVGLVAWLPLDIIGWAASLAIVWTVGLAAYGYARPQGHGIARALGCVLLACLYLLLSLSATMFLLVALTMLL